ncbi:MAG: hypothetical protein RL179_813 [Planctomycetota bacterium]
MCRQKSVQFFKIHSMRISLGKGFHPEKNRKYFNGKKWGLWKLFGHNQNQGFT